MRKLTLKQRRWLDAYLETGNCTEAARRAGYKCRDDRSFSATGLENLEKLRIHIEKYLDEVGLSDSAVKLKIIQGMNARETKFWAYEGQVTDSREVAAWAVQARYTELAARVRGMLDSEIGRRIDELERKVDEVLSRG